MVEVLGEVVRERRVLRHRSDEREEVRLRRGHEVRPPVDAEHEGQPQLVHPPAERLVERATLEDRLPERPGRVRRRVAALSDERVDGDVSVADGDRIGAVVKPRIRLPDGRCDRPLQDAARPCEAEAGRVGAFEDRREVVVELLEHESLVPAGSFSYGVRLRTSRSPPGTASNRSVVTFPSKVWSGISITSPCPGDTANVTPTGSV